MKPHLAHLNPHIHTFTISHQKIQSQYSKTNSDYHQSSKPIRYVTLIDSIV